MEERLSFLLQFPELNLPVLVGIIGGIVIFVLMARAPENRRRLLPLGILLPLHALLFPLAFLLPDNRIPAFSKQRRQEDYYNSLSSLFFYGSSASGYEKTPGDHAIRPAREVFRSGIK